MRLIQLCRQSISFVAGLLMLALALGFSRPSRADLGSTYADFLSGSGQFLPEAGPRNDAFQLVYVGGFGNELARDYFQTSVETLSLFGANHVHRIFPSSRRAALSNIHDLRARLLEIYHQGDGRPIILIGHSKGGLESVAVSLAYPELVRDGIIKRVVAIQAPLRGCHLGDLSGRLMWLGNRFDFFEGMRSLRTSEINEAIEYQVARLDSRTRQLVSDAVLYVTSHQEPAQIARMWRLGGRYMDVLFGAPNDGLVATHDMYLPNLGRVLGHLVADHTELHVTQNRLTRSMGLNTSSAEKIGAFHLALFVEVLNDIGVRPRTVRGVGLTQRRGEAPSCRRSLRLVR